MSSQWKQTEYSGKHEHDEEALVCKNQTGSALTDANGTFGGMAGVEAGRSELEKWEKGMW